MDNSDAAELLREGQAELLEVMDTVDLGPHEAKIDHLQEKFEDYAIELEMEDDQSA